MDQEFISRIREIAVNKHDHPSDSQRYGAAPYSAHLDDVASYANKYLHLVNEDKQEIVMGAAYTHDLIEDTDMDINTLRRLTNDDIAELVFLVSNERGRDRKERNFKTYPKIWNSRLAIFLKLCDRLANTRNSRNTGHRMFDVYKKEYPVFRYALKQDNDPYEDMWCELDDLNK